MNSVGRFTRHIKLIGHDLKNPGAGNNLYWALFSLVALAFIAQAALYVPFLETDGEGFTLYAGWLAVDKGLVPYRDFAVGYTPVSFYLYGAVQKWFGPSFYVARLEAITFLILTLLLTYLLAARFGGKWAGLIAVGLIVGNPFAFQWYSRAYLYAPLVFFVMASLAVLTSSIREPVRSVASVGLMSVAALPRQDSVIYLVLLVIYLLVIHRRSLTSYAALASAIVVPLLLMLPFLWLGWDATLTGLYYSVVPPSVGYSVAKGPAFTWLDKLRVWPEVIRTYFMLFLLLAATTLAALTRNKRELVQLTRSYSAVILLGLLFLGNVLTHYSPFYPYASQRPDHLLMALPIAATLAGIGVAWLSNQIVAPAMKVFVISLVAFGILFSAVLPAKFDVRDIPGISGLQDGKTDLDRVRIGAEAIEARTRPTDKVFSLSSPHQVFLAKRLGFDSTLNSADGFVFTEDTQWARRYHFVNEAIIAGWLSGEAEAVLMTPDDRHRLRTLMSYWGPGEQILATIEGKLKQNYTLVAVEPEAFLGPLEIYLRNDLIRR